MKNINEFFTLPGDLKSIGKIAGGDVYSSKTLNDKYLEIIKTNEITKNIYNEIEKLVNQKRIVPCFASKGLISFITHKLSFYNHSFERIAGFYLPQKNKIFIFIDNNMNILFKGSDDSIARVTIHEIVHMSATTNSEYFWELFKDDLQKFYEVYYSKLFKLNNIEQNIKDIISKLINIFYFEYEKGSNISLSQIFSLLQEFKPYSQLDEERFNNLCNLYCIAILTFSKNNNDFLDKYTKFLDIIRPIKETYNELYGEISNVIFYQEIATPSEVICISLEVRITDKIRSVVRSIL